jgi:hypothetical protein
MTRDGYVVLVEVKSMYLMTTSVSRAKAEAARVFCGRQGWGYLCTDGDRHLRDLAAVTIPEEAERALAHALCERGTLSWPEIRAIGGSCGISGRQVGALALRRGWAIRMGPYRLTET